MAPIVSVKNKAFLDVEACEELHEFPSNEVTAEYVNIRITKTQSCRWAFHGGHITYCVKIENLGGAGQWPMPMTFRDVLDSGVQYVTGSFMVNGQSRTPQQTGQTLTYSILDNDIGYSPDGNITICFTVKVL